MDQVNEEKRGNAPGFIIGPVAGEKHKKKKPYPGKKIRTKKKVVRKTAPHPDVPGVTKIGAPRGGEGKKSSINTESLRTNARKENLGIKKTQQS